MNDWVLYSIGFFAQILFSSRLIVQWVTTEKQKQVSTPVLFWTLSLIASFLLFIYGYFRNDFPIMLGQTLTYFIYIRNLQLQNQWTKLPRLARRFIFVFPILIGVYYCNTNVIDIDNLFRNEAIPLWLLLLGIVSQLVFTLRFIYQWIYSEKKKESTLPFGFWVLSLIGSLLILTYAIIRRDPVLFVGHILGTTIYIRNIMILKRSDT